MTESLYQRLGQAAGIARLVEDTVAAHLRNPVVSPRFAHVADLDHLKQAACDFFCAGSGGPEAYTGKDMRAVHRGMNISEQEYLAVMDDIVEALDKNGVDTESKKDVISILYSLKDEIIHV